MRVYLCSDFQNQIKESGVGRALLHQQAALEAAGIDYTTDGREPYDIIHLNTIFPNSYIKARHARRRGRAVVYHAHSTAEDFRNSFFFANALAPGFKQWLRKAYNTADLVLTPTAYSKNLLESYDLTPPIYAISNGIEPEFWQADDFEKRRFRKMFDLRPTDPLVIAVGLQIKRKGVLEFIEMARQMPDVQFIWFGYTDPKLLDRQMRRALQVRLPNLRFAGYVERDVMRVAYQAADLYLFPTHEETEGIVLLEALASRTPTIVRDLPVFDAYADGRDLYKARTTDEFIQKSYNLLNHRLPDLTTSGYHQVEQYTLDKIGAQLHDYYELALQLATER